MHPETLKALVKDRLVGRISSRYEPPDRLRGDEAGQRDYLADLTAAVMTLIPNHATPDSVGLVIDSAWMEFFATYKFQAWPRPPEVLAHVREAVAKAIPPRSMPVYAGGPPRLPRPEECRRRADMWAAADCPKTAEHWRQTLVESERQWSAYRGSAAL